MIRESAGKNWLFQLFLSWFFSIGWLWWLLKVTESTKKFVSIPKSINSPFHLVSLMALDEIPNFPFKSNTHNFVHFVQVLIISRDSRKVFWFENGNASFIYTKRNRNGMIDPPPSKRKWHTQNPEHWSLISHYRFTIVREVPYVFCLSILNRFFFSFAQKQTS